MSAPCAVLNEALPDGGVVIGQDLTTSGGNFLYIHKVKDGCSLVFLANSSDGAVDTWVSLRGKLVPEIWNPHDGKMGPSEYEHVAGKVGTLTRVHVKLPPVRSMFLVANEIAVRPDASRSSVEASPPTLASDGVTAATITVALKDAATAQAVRSCGSHFVTRDLIFPRTSLMHVRQDAERCRQDGGAPRQILTIAFT